MTLTKILTPVFFAISLYLGYFLYSSIQETLDSREAIAGQEALVIDRLQLIREAEKVYLEVNKKYTSSWDTLANFIRNGQVPIIERWEQIEMLAYGAEEVTVHFDTLGYISARERIFEETFNVNAADSGRFVRFNVAVGDPVSKGQRLYAIEVGGRVVEPPSLEEGVVTSLANVTGGEFIQDGQQLITITNQRFNPNTDISKIGEVPGWDDGREFEIFAGTATKAGLAVQVIEVVDPTPIDPERKESNEHKARKPLRFGSQTDVTTAGNWE